MIRSGFPNGEGADPSAAVFSHPPWIQPRAAYIHVPFCRHHCGYCDFAVVTGKDDQIDRYLDALEAEISTLGEPQPVRTLFLGGGTPTHLEPTQLDRLLTMLDRRLYRVEEGEYSVEANPDTLTADKIAVLADHGVNRVSLGAQTFHEPLLAMLERSHDPGEIGRAAERVRRRIPQVSLDLIFGIPGQTLAQWDTDLRHALALSPDHLSTYGLTYEKGTPLWKHRRRGELQPVEEDQELAMYQHAIERLESAGFEHYEISNFARSGCRSLHNQTYWANEAYFGFGLGAARYVQGCREVNTRDLQSYIRRCLAGESPTQQSEELPAEERARETMAVQLRRMEGIDREAFHVQTEYALDDLAGEAMTFLVEQGLFRDDGRHVALTREGKYVADGVIERLLRSG